MVTIPRPTNAQKYPAFTTAMQEAFTQLEHAPLRTVLLESLDAQHAAVEAIGDSFAMFTAKKYPLQKRQQFFASWQRTNNSAMSVEGLANRMTHNAESVVTHIAGAATSTALHLFRSAGRLNRVTDEDLGVGGQILHFELYYRMATALCDGEDGWQSRRACLTAAADFKCWLDDLRLKEPIMLGLFSMLIHEGYTHAELEFLEPLFTRWVTEVMGFETSEMRRTLAWIYVHNGGTEKQHFVHASAAFEHYRVAKKVSVDLTQARELFDTYLQRKGKVMSEIAETLA